MSHCFVFSLVQIEKKQGYYPYNYYNTDQLGVLGIYKILHRRSLNTKLLLTTTKINVKEPPLILRKSVRFFTYLVRL